MVNPTSFTTQFSQLSLHTLPRAMQALSCYLKGDKVGAYLKSLDCSLTEEVREEERFYNFELEDMQAALLLTALCYMNEKSDENATRLYSLAPYYLDRLHTLNHEFVHSIAPQMKIRSPECSLEALRQLSSDFVAGKRGHKYQDEYSRFTRLIKAIANENQAHLQPIAVQGFVDWFLRTDPDIACTGFVFGRIRYTIGAHLDDASIRFISDISAQVPNPQLKAWLTFTFTYKTSSELSYYLPTEFCELTRERILSSIIRWYDEAAPGAEEVAAAIDAFGHLIQEPQNAPSLFSACLLELCKKVNVEERLADVMAYHFLNEPIEDGSHEWILRLSKEQLEEFFTFICSPDFCMLRRHSYFRYIAEANIVPYAKVVICKTYYGNEQNLVSQLIVTVSEDKDALKALCIMIRSNLIPKLASQIIESLLSSSKPTAFTLASDLQRHIGTLPLSALKMFFTAASKLESPVEADAITNLFTCKWVSDKETFFTTQKDKIFIELLALITSITGNKNEAKAKLISVITHAKNETRETSQRERDSLLKEVLQKDLETKQDFYN